MAENISNELREALNNLYAATVRVMELVAPDMVNNEQRTQAVAGLIANYLSGAAMRPETAVRQEHGVNNQNNAPSQDETHSDGEIARVIEPQPNPTQIVGTVKYARFGVDNGDGNLMFKRNFLLSELPADSEKARQYFFKLTLDEENGKGVFSFLDTDCADGENLVEFKNNLCDDRMMKANGEISATTKIIRTITPGEVVLRDRRWMITKPAVVSFESPAEPDEEPA